MQNTCICKYDIVLSSSNTIVIISLRRFAFSGHLHPSPFTLPTFLWPGLVSYAEGCQEGGTQEQVADRFPIPRWTRGDFSFPAWDDRMISWWMLVVNWAAMIFGFFPH